MNLIVGALDRLAGSKAQSSYRIMAIAQFQLHPPARASGRRLRGDQVSTRANHVSEWHDGHRHHTLLRYLPVFFLSKYLKGG